MSRIRRISPGLGRGGLIGNTEGPESYLRELDTLPSQFCRATGGTETVISQGGKFYRVHTFTDTDPTSLLLNFDGANGSTTFTDDSGWGHAVTANGNAAISTTQSKFGGSSAYFDGTGDYLTLSSSTFAFGTGDFTIEFWARSNDVSGSGSRGFLQTSANAGGLSTSYSNGVVIVQGIINNAAGNGGIGANINGVSFSSSSAVLSVNTWHHIALARSGSTARLFVDGTQVATATSTADITGSNLAVGGYYNSSYLYDGYIDSLRITKGQALYTAAFTPPTTALARVGSGSLTFTRGGSVEYLVVGGGGGGAAGGGGAGGFRTGTGLAVKAGAPYAAAVGSGGASVNNAGPTYEQGNNGSSSAFGIVTAAGGGGGAAGGASGVNGSDGGSGGGGFVGGGSSGFGTGGTGNTPSVSPSQGSNGGNSAAYTPAASSAGGGGGAGAVGSTAPSSDSAGSGGAGSESSITGTSLTYAGGGGAGLYVNGTPASGGSGGGGNGATGNAAGSAGTANTGGGGGGGISVSYPNSYAGGSGIVVARYRITQAEYEAEAA